MQKVFRKILEILDDTPAVYGKRQRGQSVLELALVSPLLIILLAGLAEIGWFAQNYLTIMEVTRVGARTGTVQSGNTSPLYWEDPDNGLFIQGSHPPPIDWTDLSPGGFVSWWVQFRDCDRISTGEFKVGFYNFLGCIMIRSMNPLEFHGDEPGEDMNPDTSLPYPDDIIISAFSARAFDDPLSLAATVRNDINWPNGNTPDADQPQVVVVGRFPSNANECTAAGDRDPFDYVQDGAGAGVTTYTDGGGNVYNLEMFREVDGGAEPYADIPDEDQRGFVWIGQHIDPESGCRGSEWSTEEVERLINLQGFEMDEGERKYVPSQGIILVEMHWHHESLTQFIGLAPVLSPVLAIMGEETTISVWAAFPLPTVEPRFEFPSGWE
jgi:hypothetical protein